MKILRCRVDNFASYKSLEFNFADQGLCLVSGPTGSGKSTLCDIVPWILFGRTAKDGAVDEVRAWNSHDGTTGLIALERPEGGVLYVHRMRAPNDLYFDIDGGPPTRGKDLADTQRLINQAIGIDLETYLAGAYFHELSHTASFFIANAKQRRTLVEQMVDLSLATKLTNEMSEYKKELKKEITAAVQSVSLNRNTIEILVKKQKEAKLAAKAWADANEVEISIAQSALDTWAQTSKVAATACEQRREAFEIERRAHIAKLEEEIATALSLKRPDSYYEEPLRLLREEQTRHAQNKVCPTCGASEENEHRWVNQKDIYRLELGLKENRQIDITVAAIKRTLNFHVKQKNPHPSYQVTDNPFIAQLEKLRTSKNPHEAPLTRLNKEVRETRKALIDAEDAVQALNQDLDDIETLLDVTASFRATIVKSSISILESSTNEILATYFDAEIRVMFSSREADKIDVQLYKDGNLCSYSQLSKGQRQLLKLCFSVSVMKSVANFNHTQFDALFFDEALDGLDDNLKLKSFRLFESLALNHSSVFVVEHSSALKICFNKHYGVALVNGVSVINE